MKPSPTTAATHRAPNRERLEGGTGVKLPVGYQNRHPRARSAICRHRGQMLGARHAAENKPRRARRMPPSSREPLIDVANEVLPRRRHLFVLFDEEDESPFVGLLQVEPA
jgi:hypothetical protein